MVLHSFHKTPNDPSVLLGKIAIHIEPLHPFQHNELLFVYLPEERIQAQQISLFLDQLMCVEEEQNCLLLGYRNLVH